MKPIILLLLSAVLSSAAFAQNPRLFVTAGAGFARFDAGDFNLTTAYGEVLPTTDEKDAVSFIQAGVGCSLGDRWGVQLQYTDFRPAEVSLAFPVYPGWVSILPFPAYSRNVLRYDAWRVALLPSYTFPLGTRFSARIGAGVTRTHSTSRAETRYYAWFSGRPNGEYGDVTANVNKTSWSYATSLALEYKLSDHWSINVSGSYAPFKIAVVPINIGFRAGSTASKRSVKVSSLEAALSIVWRN